MTTESHSSALYVDPFHWSSIVLDCFNHECDSLECIASSLNAFIAFVTALVSCAQTVVVVKNTGSLHSWKSASMFVILFQSVFLFLDILLVHNIFWFYVALAAEMGVFLAIVFFFLRYTRRVSKHKDALNPCSVIFIVSLGLGVLALFVIEVLRNFSHIAARSKCGDAGLLVLTSLQCLLSFILCAFVFKLSKSSEAKTNSGELKRIPRSFFIAGLMYFIVSLVFLLFQLVFLFYFRTLDKCATELQENALLYFFFSLIRILFGLEVPVWVVLFIFHILGNDLHVPQGRRMSTRIGINRESDSMQEPLLGIESDSRDFVDRASQLFLSSQPGAFFPTSSPSSSEHRIDETKSPDNHFLKGFNSFDGISYADSQGLDGLPSPPSYSSLASILSDSDSTTDPLSPRSMDTTSNGTNMFAPSPDSSTASSLVSTSAVQDTEHSIKSTSHDDSISIHNLQHQHHANGSDASSPFGVEQIAELLTREEPPKKRNPSTQT